MRKTILQKVLIDKGIKSDMIHVSAFMACLDAMKISSDLQILKEGLIPSFSTLKACLEMLTYSLKNIQVRTNIVEEDKYLYLFSVEEVNKLVQNGTPFRDAYRIVGKNINEGTFNPDKTVNHTHKGSVGNLCLEEIVAKKNAI